MEQLVFLKDYVADLKKAVISDENITAYGRQKFDYDKNATFATTIERDDNLLSKMMAYTKPNQDYEAAIVLFETFPELDRIQAAYEPFWAYLAHVDLYPYMIKRFCNGNAPNLTDVKINWWHSNLMRRGLSNLWWSVKQTAFRDEDDKYNYEYTKYFFKRIDFRQRRMGSSTLFRHKEAVLGILKFLKENVDEKYFEGRANFIMMYFNKLATIKQLASCDRDYFYDELLGIKEQIMKVQDRTEASAALQDEGFE